jgi:cell wall-associated NlpC family hydrolase
MKKIITNFLLLIFCSVPRLIKAQIRIDKVNTIKEEKNSEPRFIENISFTPSGDRPSAGFMEVKSALKKELNTANVSATNGIEKIFPQQAKYAMILDVAIESIKNTALYQFIENWYGTRYRMGGTTKRGIDCSAFADKLLSAVYALVLPRTAREQYKFCEHISKDDLLEGDLVFFNTRNGVSHVGVYLANGHFVHSSRSQGVMISSLEDNYYSRRFISGGRVN